MSKTRFIILAGLLCISICLTGCRLAKTEEQNPGQESGSYCGVFITYGAPDTEDTIIEGTPIRSGSGLIEEYEFEGLKGSCFFEVLQFSDIPAEDGSRTAFHSDAVCDVKVNVNVGDEGRETTLEGRIYLSGRFQQVVYCNPVYQREDGSIYTVPGSAAGIMVSGDSGGDYGYARDSSYTAKVNGKESVEKLSCKINFERVDRLKEVIVKEYDEQDYILNAASIRADLMESDIKLQNKTAYVIVEENYINSDGEEYKKRTAFDCDRVKWNKDAVVTEFLLRFENEEGIVIPSILRIIL